MPTSRDDLVRSALRVSAFSASWTLAASTAAVVVGLANNSLALVAFGVVILDCAGSVAPRSAHFRDARKAEGPPSTWNSIAKPRHHCRVIAVGLATAAVSIVHLLEESAAATMSPVRWRGSPPPCVAGTASPQRFLRKLLIMRRELRCHAADSHLSAIGAVLAAVTLGGDRVADKPRSAGGGPIPPRPSRLRPSP